MNLIYTVHTRTYIYIDLHSVLPLWYSESNLVFILFYATICLEYDQDERKKKNA